MELPKTELQIVDKTQYFGHGESNFGGSGFDAYDSDQSQRPPDWDEYNQVEEHSDASDETQIEYGRLPAAA